MQPVPVVLVVYNRPRHTFEVLKALRRHNVQNLYIFADGPKSDREEQQVRQVRELLRRIDWCRPVIVQRDENIGLARSIVAAADYVFQKYDKLVLLEDDCVPQEYFFDFMHTCLGRYENNPQVFGISGYTVAVPDEILKGYPYDLYFCPRIGSWGWATWKRAWQYRGNDLSELIDIALRNGVDLDQGGTDIPIALENILKGNVKDVWTLHWVLSVYINKGVYIYPTRSHVLNIGIDGTGVHCRNTHKYDSVCCNTRPINYPDEVLLDRNIMANFRSYYDAAPARRARVRLSQKPVTKRPLIKKPAMKVCYVNAGDIKGGAHRVGWWLKEGLKRRGFPTKMFVRVKLSDDPDVSIITDAVMDSGSYHKGRGFLYYDINSTFTLSGKQDFITSDIIHYHNLHGDYFNPFALPRLTSLKPSVWTLHDMQSITGHCAYAFDCTKWQTGCGNCPSLDSHPRVTKDRTARMWQDKRKIYQESDFELIVPSQWLKSLVEKSMLREKKIHLIYNGIDERVYRPYDKRPARGIYDIPQDSIVLAFAAQGGLIDSRKGNNFLLEAHKYFTSKYPNVYFMCIGGRSDKAPTERLLQIPFILDENKLAQVYSAADIFLFPTLADNCPLVVLELMGCGVPIVSFNTGGVPELIEQGKTGFVAGYKNGEEFIKMTEWLILNKAGRKEFSRAGLERLRKSFTMDSMLDKHIRLYQKLIEAHKEKTLVQPKNKVSLTLKASERKYKYLVSAIVSTYNSEKVIRGCLEDLENQTIADRLEIVVVNSGSRQNEEAIVREFQQKYDNVKYIRTEKRETIFQAWNRGIKAAAGKYITNANTDDRHSRDALEKMVKALEENPQKVLVYANQKIVKHINGRLIPVGEIINGDFLRARLFTWCLPGSQPLWRKDVHDVLGYFDEQFAISGDYEFWFRLTQKFDFMYLDEFLGERFVSSEANSQSDPDLHRLENIIIHKCYTYAEQTSTTVEHKGISGHPLFVNWPEVNLWKRKVKARFEGKTYSALDNIRTQWDLRRNEQPKLSVVVVAYNNETALLENLEALRQQSEQDFEVIVVSNGLDISGLKNIAGTFSNGLCAVELTCNLGPSAARNIGISRARAECIAFLDDDAMAEKDFVKNIVSHFRDYDICGLRGKVRTRSDKTREHTPAHHDLGEEIIFTACEPSSHSAYRKDILGKVGGFDQELFGLEGLELCYRIHRAQNERLDCIRYFPDVVVFHDNIKELEQQVEKDLREEAMSKLARQKWPEIEGYFGLVRSSYPANKETVERDYDWLLSNSLYLQKTYPSQAVTWGEKAVSLEPDAIKGRYVLGSIYTTLGRYDEGQAMIEPILNLLMETLQSACSKESAEELENFQNTAECYLSACTKLAQCYMKLGQYDRLKQVYIHLLSNPHITLPEQQKANIQSILAKLQKVSFPAAQAAATPKTASTAGSQADRGENFVSAIVSTYNSERFLRGCLDDLECQTIADKLEIIVINSGSEQNEEAIVREYQQRYNNIVYIKTEQREGLYRAWNRGVRTARGRFITNANTDDRHQADALEVMARTLETNPEAGLVYGDQIFTETENATFENPSATRMHKWPDYSTERLLLGCCVGSQPMWRKSLHQEIGYFDESLTAAGDWDFWIRISSRYKLKHIPEFLGLYYHNKKGVEHGQKIHSLYERYLVGKRYGTEYIATIPFYKSEHYPLVSVIMPAYNAQAYIAEAIESVLIQSYRNFELMVIDDGSTDRTPDIVSAFEDEKIRYLYKENAGPASARNLGLRSAKGEFIIFLDSDDMMQPDYIINHLQQFKSHPQADLIYCDHGLIDEQSKPIRVIEQIEYQDQRQLIRDMLRCGYPIIQPRGCLKRSAIEKTGSFDEQLPVAEDYDFMRRFIEANLKARHLKGAFYLRRMHPESLCKTGTPEKATAHFKVIKRIIETFSPDELFPDVDWKGFPQDKITQHAKCLTGATLLAIAQNYQTAGEPLNVKLALQQAQAALKDCLRLNPDHSRARQLLQQCEKLGASLSEARAVVV